MLQVPFIRENKDAVIKGLAKRNIDATQMINDVIDLDEDSTTAIARVEYRPILKNMHLLFDLTPSSAVVEPRTHFYKNLTKTSAGTFLLNTKAPSNTEIIHCSYCQRLKLF